MLGPPGVGKGTQGELIASRYHVPHLSTGEMFRAEAARDTPVGNTLSPAIPFVGIMAQAFDTETQRAFGENMSFTPWHSLPVHRPLGGINRARKIVYDAISTFRHERNNIPRQEPESWNI